MRVTTDDFEPRRDGWFEHKGTWQEVTVGTVLGTSKRSDAFEVLQVAHGQQVQYGYTLWFQVKNLVTGEITAIEPKWKVAPVTILTRDPRDTRTAPPTEPTDSQAILLLVEELGASWMATHDSKTGEVTCPDYDLGYHARPGGHLYGAEYREHLIFAHGFTQADVDAIDAADDSNWSKGIGDAHSRAHDMRYPDYGKGGFPHRHVPEELEYLG